MAAARCVTPGDLTHPSAIRSNVAPVLTCVKAIGGRNAIGATAPGRVTICPKIMHVAMSATQRRRHYYSLSRF